MILSVLQQRRALPRAAPVGRNDQRAQQCNVAEELEPDQPRRLSRRSREEKMLAVSCRQIFRWKLRGSKKLTAAPKLGRDPMVSWLAMVQSLTPPICAAQASQPAEHRPTRSSGQQLSSTCQ